MKVVIQSLILSVLFIYPAFVLGQVQPTDLNLDTGVKPFETFDQGQGNVNIASGNLNIQIPLVHLPGRNGHDFDLELTYNSQNWSPIATPYVNGSGNGPNPNSISIGWNYGQGEVYNLGTTGWQLNIPVLYFSGVTVPPACAASNDCGQLSSYTQSSSYTNFFLVMGDGRKYQFPFASMCNLETVTQPSGFGFSENTLPVPQTDVLVDYDSLNKGGGGSGEGVMLDLTNAANGTGTAAVRMRDGSQVLFSASLAVCSAAGNEANAAGPMYMPATALVDSNGNVISVAEIMGSTGVSTSAGIGGVQYKNSNGQPEAITFNYSARFPNTPPTWQTPTVGNGILFVNTNLIGSMLSSVVLPDNLTYTFQYNAYGELTEITYPSGGYSRYVYSAVPNENGYQWTTAVGGFADNRVVVAKYTCTGQAVAAGATTPSGYVGGTPSSTCPVAENRTEYVRTSQAPHSVAVTDPLGNETDYSFEGGSCAYIPFDPPPFFSYADGPSILESSRSVYEGPASSGKHLRTTYSNYLSGCQGGLKTSEMTVLPNGDWTESTWSYDTAVNNYYTPAITDHGTSIQSIASAETDNMLVKNEYGFGSGPNPTPPSNNGQPLAPALPLLRQTVNCYLSQGLSVNPVNGVDYEVNAIYILNRLQYQATYSGSGGNCQGNGAQIGQTTYTYDSYPQGLFPGGTVQHGTSLSLYDQSVTTRGNVTDVYNWVSSGQSSLHTHYQFDVDGNVVMKTDPAGNSTQFSFGDSWGNSTCAPSSGLAGAFPTTITTAMGEITKYTWNSCTGTIASTTDTNSQTTIFSYDSMDRRVLASYPDGGQTCLQYSDAPNSYSPTYCPSPSGGPLPIQIASTKKLNNGGETDSTTIILDGLSRVQQTQHTSDPYGVDYVNTTYDGNGDVASVTNPFRLAGEPTDGTVQYQYDALGRKIIQTQQDGSSLRWCYDGVTVSSLQGSSLCSQNFGNQSVLGSWTDIEDETGRHWQQTEDALGRLVKVLEPNPANTLTAAPADETDYTYNALNDLTHVDQWNGAYGATPDLQRSFSYDGIARLIASSNPETGTISYNYQNSTAGFCSGDPTNPCSRTDAIPTTTSYSYDSDNNLIGKTYSDATPAATFVYQHGNGSTSNNANGRLIQEYTGSSTSPLASTSGLAYDQIGRSVQKQQCVFGNCTANPPAWSSSESGCTGSSFSPTGNELLRAYDCAGDLTSWTAGVPIPNTTNPIVLSATYDPASRLGAITSSWSDANHPSTLFWAGYNGSSSSQVDNVNPYGPVGLNAADLAYSPSSGTGTILVARAYDNRMRVLSEYDTSGAVAAAGATVTIAGTEQSQQTSNGVGSADSTGSVTLSGSEQSQASSSGVGSAPGTGWINIAGTEQSANAPGCPGNCPVYDNGTFLVTINGVQVASYTYGQSDTSSSISSALASGITQNSAVVSANAGLGLTSKTNGANTDYTLQVSFSWGSNQTLFGAPSFSASTSGPELTGGKDGTLYDSGTVTATLNGHPDAVSYGQGSTASTIASGLASAINADGAASVTATASGATLNLQSRQPGASTDWSVGTSVAYNSTHFSSPSFSATHTGMSGGQNGTTYDSGSVSITVGGHTDSVPFGTSSTSATIATALNSAINADTNAAVTSTVASATLTLKSKEDGPGADDSLSVGDTYNGTLFSQSSFTASPSSSSLTGGSASSTLYSYGLTYDSNGNLWTLQDSVVGNWTFSKSTGYDSLNRLVGGSTSSGYYTGTNHGPLNVNWSSIDKFGNNGGETFTGSSNVGLTQPEALTFSHGNNRADQFTYDNAGRTTADFLHSYLYDAEGRVCAVELTAGGGVTQYLYDAEGNRIAKGGGSFACVTSSTTPSTFSQRTWFILDGAGQQMTEMDYGSGQWQWAHSNVFAGSKLLATYCATGTAYCDTQTPTTFALSDWLGTKRVQAAASGIIDIIGSSPAVFPSLPYGDQAPPAPLGATDHFFTGKERDAESGNDYFGARYYASSMGRWLSPDPINLTNARLMNPANTLNKYAYGANNPLKYVDPDGKDITIYYRAPSGGATDFGHVMLGVLNQDTGKTAFIDFYPKNGTNALGQGPGTFNPGDMAERGQQNANGQFASLTIQTNPEQAQALIDAITKMENGQAPDYSAFLGTNCTTLIEDALKDLGMDYGDQSPTAFWQDVWGRYSQDALDNPFKIFIKSSAPTQGGRDYGNPRFNNQSQMMFYLYWLQMHPNQDNSSVTTTETYSIDCQKNPGACK